MLSNSALALNKFAVRKPAYFKDSSQATSLQDGTIVGQESGRRTKHISHMSSAVRGPTVLDLGLPEAAFGGLSGERLQGPGAGLSGGGPCPSYAWPPQTQTS